MIMAASQLENNEVYIACGVEKVQLNKPYSITQTRSSTEQNKRQAAIKLPPLHVQLPRYSEEFIRCQTTNPLDAKRNYFLYVSMS